jgi:hypothetical protein
MTVVVLPTPPFMFTTATILAVGTASNPTLSDAAVRPGHIRNNGTGI